MTIATNQNHNTTAQNPDTWLDELSTEPVYEHDPNEHPDFQFIGGIAIGEGERGDAYYRSTSQLWFAQGAVMVRRSGKTNDVIAKPITPLFAHEYEALITGLHYVDVHDEDDRPVDIEKRAVAAPLSRATQLAILHGLVDESELVKNIRPHFHHQTGKEDTFEDPAVKQIVVNLQGFKTAGDWIAGWNLARESYADDPRVRAPRQLDVHDVHRILHEGLI